MSRLQVVKYSIHIIFYISKIVTGVRVCACRWQKIYKFIHSLL